MSIVMAAGIFCSAAIGQEKTSANAKAGLAAYDVERETTLIGMVQSYTPAAETAPRGAQIKAQGGVL